MTNRVPRWGIMGGVFDPIHYAHLAIAEQTRESLALDHVVFVPASVPVHRSPAHVAANDRVAMVELATADNESFSVSRIEVDGRLSGYTADTVEQLAADNTDADWVLILSTESA